MFNIDNYRITLSCNDKLDSLYIQAYDISNFELYSRTIDIFVLNEEIRYFATIKKLYNLLNKIFEQDEDDLEGIDYEIKINLLHNQIVIYFNIDIKTIDYKLEFNIILNKEKTDKSKDVLLLTEHIKTLQDEIEELKEKLEEVETTIDYKFNCMKEEPLVISLYYCSSNRGGVPDDTLYFIKLNKNSKICITSWNMYAPLKDKTNTTDFKIINIPLTCVSPQNHNYVKGFYTKWNIAHLILNNIYLHYREDILEDIEIFILEIIFPNSETVFNIKTTVGTLILRSDINILDSLKTGVMKIRKEIIIYDSPKLKTNVELKSWCKENKIKIKYL